MAGSAAVARTVKSKAFFCPSFGFRSQKYRGLTVEEVLVVGLNFPNVGMIGPAPDGKPARALGYTGKLIDLAQTHTDATAEHEHVHDPAPVLDAVKRRKPTIVPGVRRNTCVRRIKNP